MTSTWEKFLISLLMTEDIRVADGRFSEGFIDTGDLDILVAKGKVKIKKYQGVKFYTLTAKGRKP